MNQTSTNELTIIYNSAKDGIGNVQRFAESVAAHPIKTIDLQRQALTEGQLAELAAKAGSTIEELMDHTGHAAKKHGDDLTMMDPYGMLTMMVHEPGLIRTPIVVMGTRAFLVDDSYDLVCEEINIQTQNRI